MTWSRLFDGMVLKMGPPKKEVPSLSISEFYCEECHETFDEETEYMEKEQKFMCKTCKKKVG